jgi:endonuclease/exonuclease/phosphatase family metal-dependent hydrolase
MSHRDGLYMLPWPGTAPDFAASPVRADSDAGYNHGKLRSQRTRPELCGMHFRLMSYNIHKGIGGVDRKYDLGRIADTINFYLPDVAVLQEVDEDVPRSGRHRQIEMLSAATELPHFTFQRTVRLRTGHYGNAILSRHALVDPADVDLTIRPKKCRGAMIAKWRVPVGEHTKTMVLVNVHLGLSGIERQIQLRRLLKHGGLAHLPARTPLVIAGDYNDVWSSLGRRVMFGAGFELAGPKIRTFPASVPLRPLDRVFYRGDLRAVHAYAGHSQLARRASDHLPLVVEFEFTRK